MVAYGHRVTAIAENRGDWQDACERWIDCVREAAAKGPDVLEQCRWEAEGGRAE